MHQHALDKSLSHNPVGKEDWSNPALCVAQALLCVHTTKARTSLSSLEEGQDANMHGKTSAQYGHFLRWLHWQGQFIFCSRQPRTWPRSSCIICSGFWRKVHLGFVRVLSLPQLELPTCFCTEPLQKHCTSAAWIRFSAARETNVTTSECFYFHCKPLEMQLSVLRGFLEETRELWIHL